MDPIKFLSIVSTYIAWLVVPVAAFARLGTRGRPVARWRVAVALLAVVVQAVVGFFVCQLPLAAWLAWHAGHSGASSEYLPIYYRGAMGGLISVPIWALFWFFVGEGWHDSARPPVLRDAPESGHEGQPPNG